MESASINTARQRKACINCYQKKVRCDYGPDSYTCTRCIQYDLDCVLPGAGQATSRSSIRQAPTAWNSLEDLSSRVQQLEEILKPNFAGSNAENVATSSVNPILRPSPDLVQEKDSPLSSTRTSRVKSYRGPASSWSALVSHLDSRSDSQSSSAFQESAARLAEDERSSNLSESMITYDLLQEFPRLGQDEVLAFIRSYAMEAPYPIVHYESLNMATEQLLQTQRSQSWGRVVCILLYIAFGSARTPYSESRITSKDRSRTYLQRIWELLPQLILEHDLWALKGLTLIVHYLQASSQPEPCWVLLGTASRLAISLGFHQRRHKVDSYSTVESEEGKRAWWLCYVMEKTFCTTFGYPSLTSSVEAPSDFDYPAPFEPQSRSPTNALEDSTIFGQNEVNAVEFFRDMIDLTYSRDCSMKIELDPKADAQTIKKRLLSTLRDGAQGQFSPSPTSTLRTSISDLAHYNAIQVIALQLSPRSALPHESLLSARASLKIILETQTAGTTMCLWMWLYYAFTAAVVIFLQSLATPLQSESILDLALLSDLQALCVELAPSSEGARRIMDISGQMEKVAFAVAKRAARDKPGKRRAEEDAGELRREKNRKIVSDITGYEAESSNPRIDVPGFDQQNFDDGVEPTGTEILETTPQTFQWDQWDQWLEGIPFEPEG